MSFTGPRQTGSQGPGKGTLFENFRFSFGGKSYLHAKGGPIGARVTMCAARMGMEDWGESYTLILLNSGLRVWWIRGYVDDGRQNTSRVAIGMRFNKQTEIFEVTEEGKKEDLEIQEERGETDCQRMARVCPPCMNSINQDLVFTVECEDDFPEKRLPP